MVVHRSFYFMLLKQNTKNKYEEKSNALSQGYGNSNGVAQVNGIRPVYKKENITCSYFFYWL